MSAPFQEYRVREQRADGLALGEYKVLIRDFSDCFEFFSNET